MAALRPITHSPPLPEITASSDWETRINVLAARSKLCDRSDVRACLAYKQCKRDLKDSAKKDEIPQDLRKKILDILAQKGFRTSNNDPRFRGLPVQSTRILLFSPKLWDLLFHQEAHPQESDHLKSLSNEAFQKLIQLDHELKDTPIETLVELKRVASLINFPELETIYANALESRIPHMNRLSMRELYLFASVWPPGKDELFSKLLALLPRVLRESFPKNVLPQTIAQEFSLFDRVAANGKKEDWQAFAPETLYRFFFFIQITSRLRFELFEELLILFRSGKLDPQFCKELMPYVKNSIDVRQRLKEGNVDVVLEGMGKVAVSPWHMFARSGYIQAFMRPGMNSPHEIVLSGNVAESFFLLYDLMLGKEVDVISLPIEKLWGLLQGANFFAINDFKEARAKIAAAIIENSGDSMENIAALAETVCTIPCPELEQHVLTWLKGNPHISIRGEEGKYAVAIAFNALLPFATLKYSIRVLKSFKERFPQSTIEIKAIEDSANNKALLLLCGIYCCHELGLAKEKDSLDAKVHHLYSIEDFSETKPLDQWSPSDVFFLLGCLSEKASSHFLDTLKSKTYLLTNFWKSVQAAARDQSPALLREETASFEWIASDSTGNQVLKLSAAQLPRFLYFLVQREKENPLKEPKLLLERLSKLISHHIREKSLNVGVVQRAVKDCQEFCPEQAHLVNTLQIAIDYPVSPLHLSLQLLLKLESGPQIFVNGKMGDDFERIPVESAQWAVRALEQVLSGSKALLFSPDEASRMPPAHFQALELLQRKVFGYDHEPLRTQVSEHTHLIRSFSPETLLAAASLAASIECRGFVNRCSLLYCGNDMLQFKDKDSGGDLKLNSLRSKPLEFLKAIGPSIRGLHIDVEPDPQITDGPWAKVVDACPNLYHFTLYLYGKSPSLESLPLSKLSKLDYLTISPRDAETWEALRFLKIPATVRHTHLFIKIAHFNSVSPYEFFDNLPPKGVTLNLDLEPPKQESRSYLGSWWSAMTQTDPAQTLLSHLRHCTELSVDTRKNDCMHALIGSVPQLEKLELQYQDRFPSIETMQQLLTCFTNLKNCNIRISLFDSDVKKEAQAFLSKIHTFEECIFKVSASGPDKKSADEITSYLSSSKSKEKSRIEVNLDLTFFN